MPRAFIPQHWYYRLAWFFRTGTFPGRTELGCGEAQVCCELRSRTGLYRTHGERSSLATHNIAKVKSRQTSEADVDASPTEWNKTSTKIQDVQSTREKRKTTHYQLNHNTKMHHESRLNCSNVGDYHRISISIWRDYTSCGNLPGILPIQNYTLLCTWL